MASAMWLRLLKLDLVLLASDKATRRRPRRRPLRPRPTAEQLEDRTLPSAGPQLLGPAVNPPPTPPPHQAPAVPAPPSPSNVGPGQNSPPPGQSNNGPGNGSGQVNDTSQVGDNGRGVGSRPVSPPGLASNGLGNGNGLGNVKGQGNEDGQGKGSDNGPGAENSQPPPGIANKGPVNGNGQGNDNGQGDENGPGTSAHLASLPSALGLSAFGAMPAEFTGESNPLGAFAEALRAEESSALGALAEESAAASFSPGSPGNGSASGTVQENGGALPFTGLGDVLTGTFPQASSSPTSGAFSGLVTGLQATSPEEGFKNPANYPRTNDPDSLFLELWDDDQLLFPDTLPPLDEMLFPEVMPKIEDLPSPNPSPLEEGSFLDPGRHSQAPIPGPAAVDDAAVVVRIEDTPASASPATATGMPSAATDDYFSELGRLSPMPLAAPAAVGREDAPVIIRWGDAPTFDTPATATGDARRFAPISQAPPANEWPEGASSTSASVVQPAAGDNLRPYKIALGMMPCLIAFGYTPSSLREHVRAGQGTWQRLRRYLHRKL